MKQVFEAVVNRAAKLAAVNITTAVLMSDDASREDTEPVCISINGTTYYETYQMKYKVEEYLKGLLQTKHGLEYRCIKVEPISGVAIAGRTTCQQIGRRYVRKRFFTFLHAVP